MIRTKVLGIGSYVPERVVTNDEICYLNHRHERCEELQIETNDEWIQKRSGIRERRYVPQGGTMRGSDMALEASQAALTDAGLAASDIDCIIFATLSPDMFFPGNGVFLQKKLGIAETTNCACYDIRQQCSGFVYALEMADAFVRAGTYKHVLLVGAELHSHSMDYSTRGRDVVVLFGDGAGALVLGPGEGDERSGITYTKCYADGNGAMDLYLQMFDTAKAPYLDYDARDPEQNADRHPQMNGKRVFLQAVRGMVMATNAALAKTGMTWDDITWFVPHQANLRINQKVAEVAQIPADKILNTIEFYGNTTAATVPLTIDYWRKAGKVKKGDRVLSAVFGSGYTWGAAIFEV